MVTPTEHSKNPQSGMFYRGFNDPNIFFDQVHANIVQNYRTQFLTYSYALFSENKNDKVEEVLDKMEEKLPRSVVPMDYRIQYDVAMMYFRIGNTAKFKELSEFVEKQALAELQKNPNDVNTYWNPYKILTDVYESRGEYSKAIDILTRLDRIAPGSPEVKMKIQMLQQKQQGK
jgi:tetratricopeptide (TPR) repeat protein